MRGPDHAPPIELRVWRQFAVLAQELHFGRAARRLGMTQPPLTQSIQQLEARLGVALFERTRRSVALTAAGQALLEPALQLLTQAAALPTLARQAADGSTGRVRLGFVSTVGFGALPQWLRGFRAANPGVVMELRESTGDVQFQAFARGELDAGFLIHAPGIEPEGSESMQRLSIGIEPLVLALPESSPWVTVARPDLSVLLAQPLVIFPRAIAPSLHDAIVAFHHRQGVTPVVAQQAIQMQTIVNLVAAGLGHALVPKSMTPLQRPGVVYRALPRRLADEAPQCETSLVWPATAAPAVLRFVEFVRARL